jgi:hypothetical protein
MKINEWIELFTRDVDVWGKPSRSSCCNWFICFSTDERTWAIGDSLRCWSLLFKFDVPCNKDSTDVNGGGGGLGLFVRDNDESMIFEEINVGLERTKRKCQISDIMRDIKRFYVY